MAKHETVLLATPDTATTGAETRITSREGKFIVVSGPFDSTHEIQLVVDVPGGGTHEWTHETVTTPTEFFIDAPADRIRIETTVAGTARPVITITSTA